VQAYIMASLSMPGPLDHSAEQRAKAQQPAAGTAGTSSQSDPGDADDADDD
jgi:hypothetical protein